MRRYTLDAVIDKEFVDFKKEFASRTEAINYLFDYLEDHYIFNGQLVEEYALDNKHNIHYVLNNAISFNVRSFAK